MNKYFITYFHKENTSFGVGNCEITSKKEIINFKDIQEIEQKIKKDNNFKGVIILNYKKLIKKERKTNANRRNSKR